jgi:hypothetical protein
MDWQMQFSISKDIRQLAQGAPVAAQGKNEVSAAGQGWSGFMPRVPARGRLTALPGSVNLGALTKTGTQFIPFQVNCNAPFNYSVRSREGALKTGALNVPPGFVVKIPYSLETRIPTNEGLIIDQCGSATLAMSVPSCGHGGSGSAIAIEQIGSLMISWAISDELVVGTYTDVVTLSVSPRL